MAEYIARKEANEWVADWLREDRSWHPYSKGKNIPTIEVFDIISRIPAADVQPVKHGKWIQDEHTYSGCWTYNYICSACGEIGGSWLRNIRRDQMFPYCPFCGAKMDGET